MTPGPGDLWSPSLSPKVIGHRLMGRSPEFTSPAPAPTHPMSSAHRVLGRTVRIMKGILLSKGDSIRKELLEYQK